MRESLSNLDSSFRWLRNELQACRFGEVGLRVIVHAGRVTRIERSVLEKEVPVEPQGGCDET